MNSIFMALLDPMRTQTHQGATQENPGCIADTSVGMSRCPAVGMFSTVLRGIIPSRYTVHSSSSSIDPDSSSSSSDAVEVLVFTHDAGER